MTITIRNARHDDIDPMVMLLKQLFAIETDFKIDAARHNRGLAMMIDGCGKHRCIKVADAQGTVVGMGSAQLLISTAEGGMAALIEDVVVDGQWRRKDIGRRLMDRLAQWAAARGVGRLQLLADRGNLAALDFYDHIGWRPTQMICLRRRLDG